MPPGADGACSDARATTSAARSGVPPEGMCQNAKAADPDADCDAKSEAFKTPAAGDVEGRETAGDAEGREAAHRPRLSSAPQEDAATVKEEDDGELRPALHASQPCISMRRVLSIHLRDMLHRV